MNGIEFQDTILNKISNLERDVSYVKGVIEGRDHKSKIIKDNISISVAFLSLLVSAIIILSKVI